MTQEDYVSFETAKLLKEKGFDADGVSEFGGFYVDYYYNGQDVGIATESEMLNKTLEDWEYLRPTLQMAMKWLREVHNFDIIAPPQFDNTKWTYSAIIFKLLIPCTEIRLNDNKDKKEAACEAAIKYCLENLI